MLEHLRLPIYVFQEFYPATKMVGREEITDITKFDRFFGFQTINFPDIESFPKKIIDYQALVPYILLGIQERNATSSDYRIANLQLQGKDPLISFTASLDAFNQTSAGFRMPLFPKHFSEVQAEFERESRLESKARRLKLQ